MKSRKSIWFTLLLALGNSAAAAPADVPLRLSVAHQPGKFVFSVENRSHGTLNYSGRAYANPPAPKGNLYLAVYDANSMEIRPCKVVDRPVVVSYARVKPGGIATVAEADSSLFEAYCLDRKLIYSARFSYWLVTGTKSSPSLYSNMVALKW